MYGRSFSRKVWQRNFCKKMIEPTSDQTTTEKSVTTILTKSCWFSRISRGNLRQIYARERWSSSNDPYTEKAVQLCTFVDGVYIKVQWNSIIIKEQRPIRWSNDAIYLLMMMMIIAATVVNFKFQRRKFQLSKKKYIYIQVTKQTWLAKVTTVVTNLHKWETVLFDFLPKITQQTRLRINII